MLAKFAKISRFVLLRWVGVLVLTALMITQFNNCGNYNTVSSDLNSVMAISCINESCVTPTLANLAINVNIPTGGSDFSVQSGLIDFNLGGDCNEGGFPYNTIKWELWLPTGVMVRNSDMPGSGSSAGGSQTANSQCVNGRFMIYVNLNNRVSGDPVSRLGLINPQAGGQRTNYDLYIQIYGQTIPGGPIQSNQIGARTRVSLNPI